LVPQPASLQEKTFQAADAVATMAACTATHNVTIETHTGV
jgi:hypothetical protein